MTGAEPASRKAEPPARRLSWWRWICVVVLILLGLAEAIGGAMLVRVHGSAFYLVAGLWLTAAAVAVPIERALARILFQLWIAGTLLWAIAETGGEFWGMISRIAYPVALWLVGLAATSGMRRASRRALPGGGGEQPTTNGA